MSNSHRLIAVGAVISALAVAGPLADAGAAQATSAAPTTTGSSIPCYPFPAFCDPTTDQPASWAPWWVWPALGLQPPQGYPPITAQPVTPQPVTLQPITLPPTTGLAAAE